MELYKSKVQGNKKRKDIKLLVICSDILHTQIPHHVAARQLNCNKIQVTGFHKTRDNRAGNLRTDSKYLTACEFNKIKEISKSCNNQNQINMSKKDFHKIRFKINQY